MLNTGNAEIRGWRWRATAFSNPIPFFWLGLRSKIATERRQKLIILVLYLLLWGLVESGSYVYTEVEFLDEIQKKVFRVFFLLCLEVLFLQTHETSDSFHSLVTVHCNGERRKT
jgi:hypothetical protein